MIDEALQLADLLGIGFLITAGLIVFFGSLQAILTLFPPRYHGDPREN